MGNLQELDGHIQFRLVYLLIWKVISARGWRGEYKVFKPTCFLPT